MPSPKEKYFFYSATIIVEPSNSKIMQGSQNVPQVRQQMPIHGVYLSQSGYFEPDDVNIPVAIPAGHIARLTFNNFKQIDKAQYDRFRPKPTEAEKKEGN